MADTTQAVDPTAAAQAATTTTPATTTAPGAQDGGKAKEQPQTGAVAKVEDLPDWAQAEIKSLRDEAAKSRIAKTNAEKAAQEAEEQRLAKDAQWQQLAEKRGGDLDALKPKADLADKLSDFVTAQYAAEIKEWPAEVKAMAPADDASILTKLEWANKARALATELLKDKTPVPGNGGRPKVASAAGVAKQDEKQRESWTVQANRRYR